ncbi:MAG TPA: DUF2075 domain-containing protein [Caldisericia bacterium]|nr:DUF2075 domain-containing protein [Caldisericia bacterium]
MRLYIGNSNQFIEDTIQNQIADKLKINFFDYYRHNPSPSEINSWRNSLNRMCTLIQYSKLTDNGIILEYQLPLTSKRLDFLITGRDKNNQDSAIIVELKQWDVCKPSNAINEVLTYVGGNNRDVLHPSVQVNRYQLYLEDTHTAFYEESCIKLSSCAYLHNYSAVPDDALYDPKFTSVLKESPLFTADEVNPLRNYLVERVGNGNGSDILGRIENSDYRPSKKLMEHVGSTIRGKSQYVLLDEQLVVYDSVLASVKEGFTDKKKTVFIIKGGPGTGKSVIAINLMADLLLSGYNSHYATGSKAFTETLREILGNRSAVQFKYFNSYMQCKRDDIDVLICDEAHRLRKTSANRFTKAEYRTNLAQVEEIINAAKVSVFFIDDKQLVKPDEIGSMSYIKMNAENKLCKVKEFELEAQFRCNGSDGFVNWINNTLGIEKTANVLFNTEESGFDFRIVDSPELLEKMIMEKVNQNQTARLMAGFCWEWSNSPNSDGTLKEDVVIGNFRRPWNARPGMPGLAKGIPSASLWAYAPNGVNQVGCIYTAQGFEFDYAGVIFGNDLTYDFNQQKWIGHTENSHDKTVRGSKEHFVSLVKNTYRVLLSRGMKGCYVYFMDKETEMFFKSRMEK